MKHPPLIALFVAGLTCAAAAQTPPVLGEQAKAMLGQWEFSNAERNKVCTATFKKNAVKVGFKVEFDANCAELFPLVKNVAGWRYPDDDDLFLLDAGGHPLVEFSEVETGMFEAPTPGVGVLFLQNAAAAATTAAKTPEDIAGDWTINRDNNGVCNLGLSATPKGDGFALVVKPGCEEGIAKLNFTQWKLDRGELVLTPARGVAWRFAEGEGGLWRHVSGSTDNIALVKE